LGFLGGAFGFEVCEETHELSLFSFFE
jgi:hypothetical protein